MTLLFFDGFQDCNTMPKPEWDVGGYNVAAGRDGSTNGSGGSGGGAVKTMALPGGGSTTVVMGVACNMGGLNQGTSMHIYRSAVGTIQLLTMVNSSGLIEVRRTSQAGTLLGTSSGHTPISAGSWHYYELKATLTTATSSTITVRLDGVTVLTITGVATSSVTGPITHISIGFPSGTNNTNFDDLYVLDTTDGTATDGRPNSDFLGDIRIQSIYPSAAGDSTQWTPTSGANYTTVDEVPVNTSDYVSDNVTGHRDLYQLSDLTGVISTVYAVREHLYAAKSDSGSVTIKPVIKETGGTVTVDAAQAPATGFGIISGTMKKVRPSDSAVWTVADVNALQAGAEVG